MTFLMTGVNSCTGAHIARALGERAGRVIGILSRPRHTYTLDSELERLRYSGVSEWIDDAPLGSDKMIAELKQVAADGFINHGAAIGNYRDPQFDRAACGQTNTRNLDAVFQAVAGRGCRRILHSGSFFEPEADEPAIGAYGLAKADIWTIVRRTAHDTGLAATKIVIPNPVGPFEAADRLIPSSVALWKQGRKPLVRAPFLVRDNLPAPWLARVYAAEATSAPPAIERVLRPSGYIMTNLEFFGLFVQNVAQLTGRKLDFEVAPVPTDAPPVRHNSERCEELDSPAAGHRFWSDWLDWLGFESNGERATG